MSALPDWTSRPRRSAAPALLRLFAGPTLAEPSAWLLPVAAMAVASALTLSVAGGVRFFFTTTGEVAGFYRLCAVVALTLLVVPLLTLAAQAARLQTTRRDERLSSLRLLGASRRSLRLLTLAEAGATSLAGAVLGVVGYLALAPLLGRLVFVGAPIGWRGLWLGPVPVVAAVVGIVLLGVLGSALGLRAVELSPLGVRRRQQAHHVGRRRVVLALVLFAVAMVLARRAGAQASMALLAVAVLVALALPLVAVELLGPWLLGALARRDARRARTAVQLLAARTLLEDPRQVWRQVSALGSTSFVAAFLGVAMDVAGATASNGQDRMLLDDLRTGALVTLAICFVTVACSTAITQGAAVLDRRQLYVGLHMVGMPLAEVDRARSRAVLRPLLWVVLLGSGSGLLMSSLLTASVHAVAPVALLTVVAVVAGGLLLVVLALLTSRVPLRQVLRTGSTRRG